MSLNSWIRPPNPDPIFFILSSFFSPICLRNQVVLDVLEEANTMNRYNGARPAVYQGALKTPNPAPQRPRFASCDRLPPVKAPRRTWADFFEDLVEYLIGIGVAVLIVELVLQIILYGYLQAPIAGPNIPGRRTHYDTLGVEHNATQDKIATAWRQKETDLHPDQVGDTEATREAYYWVQLAYIELSDQLARCYHDQYHGFVERRFGQDDPCTQILVERARDARLRDELYGNADGREWAFGGRSAWDKVYETYKEWETAVKEKEEQWKLELIEKIDEMNARREERQRMGKNERAMEQLQKVGRWMDFRSIFKLDYLSKFIERVM